jgi:hypothetical protein
LRRSVPQDYPLQLEGLDRAWAASDDRRPPKKEEPMEALTTHRRVERTIQECRLLGIEPDARTVAEIMVDDDVTAHKYEDFSTARAIALVEYERAAALALTRRTGVTPPSSKRRRA